MKQVDSIRAERITFRIRQGPDTWKLFQLGFLPDGGIWAQCPYIQGPGGFVAAVTLPAGVVDTNIALDQVSKVTKVNVKYSHHPNGEAHFSQTGKVLTLIRRASVPLRFANGHVFSATMARWSGFTKDSSSREDTPFETPKKRRTITFDSSATESMKIVARVYDLAKLKKMTHDPVLGPVVNAPVDDGMGRAYLMRPLEGKAGASRVVVISVTIADFAIPRQVPGSFFTLVGGFDPPTKVHADNEATTFLMMKYPADAENLAAVLGSIDLPGNENAHDTEP